MNEGGKIQIYLVAILDRKFMRKKGCGGRVDLVV
jgi:hypothetical protein